MPPRFLGRFKQALHLRRALRLVWESSPGWTLASLALVVAQGVLPLAGLYLMKLVVDAVAGGIAAPDRLAALRHVLLLVGLAGLVALLAAALEAVGNLVGEAHVQVVTDHVNGILHAKAIEVDLEYYENAEYYDALHRAQQEAPFRPTRIVQGLMQLGQNGITLVGITGLMFSLHWGIAAVLLAAALPVVFVRMRYADEMYRWQERRTKMERRAEYYNVVLSIPYFAKEVRLFDLGPLFRERYRKIRHQLRSERLQIAGRRSVRDLITHALAVVPLFGSYAFVASLTIQGRITLGGLVMYYSAFQRGQSALHALLTGFANLYEDNLFLTSFYDFLALKRRVTEPAHPRPFPAALQSGIVFDQVSFDYPRSTRRTITEVSLAIRPGETVALVGENGSGKTTLVKLLCRLYDVTGGGITIDGIDLREFRTTELRRGISVVFQDYARYEMTARENIWLGNLELPHDDERIERAARLAGADEVIGGLRDGYEAFLGKWLENGDELSVGEWQKVALARAFLRDAQVIILDEPTSALDARAEFEVFERFRQLVKGRTAILISHRLSSVRMADRIFVLAGGQIVESGTHEELMQRRGTYAGLFGMQARYYQ